MFAAFQNRSEKTPDRESTQPWSAANISIGINLGSCRNHLHSASFPEFSEQCELWSNSSDASTYFQLTSPKRSVAVQTIDFSGGSPSAVLIYLIGGPGGEPVIYPGGVLELLRNLFPGTMIVVPAYSGTQERMLLPPDRVIGQAQEEIRDVVNLARSSFGGAPIILIAESFGSYVAAGVKDADGKLFLSPPLSPPDQILNRARAASPDRAQSDKVLVSFPDKTNPLGGTKKFILRSVLLEAVLESKKAGELDIVEELQRYRCSLAVLGAKDHLVRKIDFARLLKVKGGVVILDADNHELSSLNKKPASPTVHLIEAAWDSRCRVALKTNSSPSSRSPTAGSRSPTAGG